MKKKEEDRLDRWEWKILRNIFGGTKISDTDWRRRANKELLEIDDKTIITDIARSQRVGWLDHIAKMPQERWVKRVLLGGEDARRRRRSRKKWLDAVKEDIRKVGVQNWQEKALGRKKWT